MKHDIDRLMAERGLEAAVVLGNVQDSPTLYYLTGGVKLEGAIVLLRPGQRPLLIHSPMERDDAVLTGMECVPASRWDLASIAREKNGDLLAARAEYLRRILADHDVHGRIGFYGHGEIGQAHALLQTLASMMPDSEIAVEFSGDLFSTARITKDAGEIALMTDVAQRTDAVVAAVADMLASRPVSNNHLMAPGGEPLTVGHVKDFIHQECVKRSLEQPTEAIFSLGADAGVPHNRGNRADVLTLGTAIIFDIFPRPVGGGYFHDMTRTWCLGYAPDEVAAAYEQVMAIFDRVMARLAVGSLCQDYQVMTCEYFAQHGHPTILSDPKTQVGYVHGLAHGLGLEVHEAPSFRAMAGNTDRVQPGMVFTVEPGLYYPDRGFGVRIEDTVVCDTDGGFRSLTPFAKDLVLPTKSVKR